MTKQEMHRVEVLIKVSHKKLKQVQAAIELGLSLRQVRRLYRQYKACGIAALASLKRGKPSNNKLTQAIRSRVAEIVTNPLYTGFGPTLMTEKLEELHHIKISRESVRQLMIQNEVWSACKKKRPVIHQQRQRRARSGELVQIDGSPHAWFEERGERCDLLVFVDDATGRTYAKFVEAETTNGYMYAMLEYIGLYGKPLAVYSDKHAIFHINHGNGTKKENFTQFGRALRELDIDLIFANSPQAKGRVERANKTLQDRLIKEMRLAGVKNIEEGNKFLSQFLGKYNKRFAVHARCPEDAHRKIVPKEDLEGILCTKHERTISKNLEFQFENEIYQIRAEKPCKSLIKAKVTAIRRLDGTLSFECNGKPLAVQKYAEQKAPVHELSSKEIDYHFDHRIGHKPSKNHPWNQEGRAKARQREQLAA
jgi:transposase